MLTNNRLGNFDFYGKDWLGDREDIEEALEPEIRLFVRDRRPSSLCSHFTFKGAHDPPPAGCEKLPEWEPDRLALKVLKPLHGWGSDGPGLRRTAWLLRPTSTARSGGAWWRESTCIRMGRRVSIGRTGPASSASTPP